VARRQLVHALVNRVGRQEVAEREVAFERIERQLTAPARCPAKRVELACEVQHAVQDGVEQRFLPETISREKGRSRPLVVDRQGEHSLELLHGRRSVFLPRVDDGFRVGTGPEPVPLRLELGAKTVMVVDLAVEGDPDPPILVAQWLVAAGAVDDCETPEAENGRFRFVKPIAVGPAVVHRIGHRTDRRADRWIDRAFERRDAADTAHKDPANILPADRSEEEVAVALDHGFLADLARIAAHVWRRDDAQDAQSMARPSLRSNFRPAP